MGTRGPVWRLLGIARPVWGRLGLATLAGAGAAGAGVALMATSAWLISRAAQHPPVLYLMVAIVAVRAFGLSRGFLRYAERLTGHDAALRVLAGLRTQVYARLARLVPARGADLRDGDVVARFVADVDACLDVVVRALLPYAVSLVIGLASVLLLVALLPVSAAILAAGLVVATVAVPASRTWIGRRAEARAAALNAQLAEQTVTLMHQMPDLIGSGALDAHLAALATTESGLRRTARARGAAAGFAAATTSAVAGACALAGLVVAASAVQRGSLNPVLVAVVVLTPLAVFDALSGLGTATAALRNGRAALDRVFGLLDADDPVPDPGVPAELPAPPYRLRMRGVAAGWGDHAVLRNVELDVAPGTSTIIVGPSGVGKSTLAALAARMIDPLAGSVELSGVDLRYLSGDQVRAVVTVVDDRAYLFDAPIAANLRIGRPDATDADLWAALADAGMDAFVASLPDGIATPVGEHGRALSGGQRRRLALARALLADPPILIVDEPDEHLDAATAAEITGRLLARAGGTGPGTRTVVLITHRSASGADHVVEVGAGTVRATVVAAAGAA